MLCAKLEADHAKQRAARPARFLPAAASAPTPLDEPGFHDRGRPAQHRWTRTCSTTPVNLLRLFDIADAARSRHSSRRAGRSGAPRCGAIDAGMARRRPHARAAFLDVAASQRHPRAALRLMNEAGVLGTLRAGVRPHRRADAVQHVPPLHGGRAHAAGRRRRSPTSSTAGSQGQHPLSTEIFPQDHQSRARSISPCCCTTPARARATSRSRARSPRARPASASACRRRRSIWSPGWCAIT